MVSETSSLCSVCKQGIPAQLVERDGEIWMLKGCPTHGQQDVKIASDAAWYHDVMSQPAALIPPGQPRDVVTGCPYDCGPCTSHEQKTYLPVLPITSACNLDCPICYTINKNEGAYHQSLDDFAHVLEVIRRNDPEMKIINFTGGEPTLHPQLPEIIRMCHDAGIHRVTISTHGLSFLNNEAMLEELAELRARIVLSFNSFDEKVNDKMLGAKVYKAKLRVLELLEKHDVDTTLIPVLARGYNLDELGDLIRMLYEKSFLRSLEIHTMTFTGQGGTGFDPAARLTTPDVLKEIERQTEGRVALSDFTPSPCAHPLCYQTAYLLDVGDGDYVPFSRFMSREQIRLLLTDNLYMEPGQKMEEVLTDVINELWSRELPGDTGDRVLKGLKNLIQRLFPEHRLEYHEQQRISEHAAKTIYIHSHMDDDTFDTDRIKQCCVGVPSADGSNIPTCAYNILYRGRDTRFAEAGLAPLTSFQGGRRWDGLRV